MNTEQYLNSKGVSLAAAAKFISDNLGSPRTIFDVALANGVTVDMLVDIGRLIDSSISRSIVEGYFNSAGINPNQLDNLTPDPQTIDVRSLPWGDPIILNASGGSFNFDFNLLSKHERTELSLDSNYYSEVIILGFGSDDIITWNPSKGETSVRSYINSWDANGNGILDIHIDMSYYIAADGIPYDPRAAYISLYDVGYDVEGASGVGINAFNALPLGDIISL